VVPGFQRDATVRVMNHVIRDRALTDQIWDLDAPGLVFPQFERR
jgi:hypothetical protein